MTRSQRTEPVSKSAPAKAGGTKGEAIVKLLTQHPSLTRAQLAERTGATVGRVGEVIRYLAAEGSRDDKRAISAHVKAQARK